MLQTLRTGLALWTVFIDNVDIYQLVFIFSVSQMQRMINQIGGQMDNLELRDKLYDLEFPFPFTLSLASH